MSSMNEWWIAIEWGVIQKGEEAATRQSGRDNDGDELRNRRARTSWTEVGIAAECININISSPRKKQDNGNKIQRNKKEENGDVEDDAPLMHNESRHIETKQKKGR